MPLASVREMLRTGWWMLLLRGVLAIGSVNRKETSGFPESARR